MCVMVNFRKCEHGSIAVKFAVMVPVLFGAVALSIDYARLRNEQVSLQSAADAAALAAAKELSLADRKTEDLPQIAKSVVEAFVSVNRRPDGIIPTTTTSIVDDNSGVQVEVTLPFNSLFGELFDRSWPDIRSIATARVVGQPNICVLGLNERENGTISLEKNARVTGQNCAVYSNSGHNTGLKSKNSANLTATTICSRGGKDGGPGNFSPAPLVDCPSFEDPLLSRPEPSVEPCSPAQARVVTGVMYLDPGTYCGLDIKDGAEAVFRDGVYVFRNGPLIVRNGGKLTAERAGLFFTGPNANFTFEPKSSISLTAPESGPMAGLLIFGSRSQSEKLIYSILSDDARQMVGTIYIPKGELRIDATSPIADQSAYTAIVADKMRLYGGPHLVLNTDYANSTVPVPEGIKGSGQPIALTR
jgi:hypothetical protein